MRAKHGIVVRTTATLLATNARAAFAGGTNEQVSVSSDGKQANGNSQRPSISRDGRFVTFDLDATKLVAVSNRGWQANGVNDLASSSADGHVAV